MEIIWSVHIRAHAEPNARRVLQRIHALLGHSGMELSFERYWKIPEQYVVRFSTPLAADTAGDAVLQLLLTAQRLGNGWCMSGLSVAENGRLTFDASSNGHFSIAGLEFVHASIDTQTLPSRQP